MKPFDLALIGVRIVAVYLVAQSLNYLPALGQAVLSVLTADFGKALPAMLLILVPFAVAWLLWVRAPRIAELATLECTETTEKTRFDQQDLVASGLIVIGIYLFATSFPILIYNIPNAFRETPPGVWSGPWSWFAANTMKCLIAIFLLFGAKNITRKILSFRHAGL